MIVGPHPNRCVVLHVVKRVKLILRQPFVAHRLVEAFDVGILLRLYLPIEIRFVVLASIASHATV
jgi:hypothetical protein